MKSKELTFDQRPSNESPVLVCVSVPGLLPISLYATTFHLLPTKVSCNTDCSPLAPCQIQNPIHSSCDHYMVKHLPTSEQPPVGPSAPPSRVY